MQKESIIQFDKVTQELLQLLSSLSPEELNKVPFEGSWTAGQIGNHLLKSYAVVETLNGSVKPTERPIDQKVEEVRTTFLNFDIKMNSPTAIIPTNDTIDKKRLLDSLETRINQLKEVIQHKDLSETCLDFIIPEYGEFTRLEWVHFNIYHTQRHVHQLKKVIEKIR